MKNKSISPADRQPNRQPPGKGLRNALPVASLGWELAIPIFLGALLGCYADQWLGTKPFFTLGLLALGLATGIYNVIRSTRRAKRASTRETRRQI